MRTEHDETAFPNYNIQPHTGPCMSQKMLDHRAMKLANNDQKVTRKKVIEMKIKGKNSKSACQRSHDIRYLNLKYNKT